MQFAVSVDLALFECRICMALWDQRLVEAQNTNEEFKFKNRYTVSIFINLRYLRLNLLKNKENHKKICHIFHHNFKSTPCYVMSEVSLKKVLFCSI